MPETSRRPDAERIPRPARIALGAAGVASWVTGAVAVFVARNGSGSVALVLAGVGASALALLGRWPTTVTVSGTEFSWDGVRKTVDGQIADARAHDQDAGTVDELVALRSRLVHLRETGEVPPHPAALYDDAVSAALRRVSPGGSMLLRPTHEHRQSVDFELRRGRQLLLVETKWRAEPPAQFTGRTLPELLPHLPPAAPLLVIANSPDVSQAERVVGAHPGPARVVGWRSAADDAALAEAVTALLA